MEESTQNFTPVYKEVAYARSTWQKVREFQLSVKELVVEVPLVFVREYLSGGERRPEIGRAVYEKIDKLQEIRRRGITAEMRCSKLWLSIMRNMKQPLSL